MILLRRLLLIFLCLLAFLPAGCTTSYTNNVFTRNRLYRKIHVTDYEGILLSDWVAEGPVWPYGNGYRFRAIEHVIGGPIPVTNRYPNGRKVIISGPNIVIMPCEKPAWLKKIDGF